MTLSSFISRRGVLQAGMGAGLGLACYAPFSLRAAVPESAPATAPPGDDPFTPFLDGKAPQILRDVKLNKTPPAGVKLRRVVFRSRDNTEIFAAIATPTTPGPHPGILVLHGGGGAAEQDRAIGWAARGYVAVAPDLPGIAEPKKLVDSKGRWTAMKYGEGRYVASPDASASVIFDAVLAAMKALYLLQAQPSVDLKHIGVVGVSWGGYMTTMVCGLSGDAVRAGYAIFGCGFYELTSQLPTLDKMPPNERALWLKHLDSGRRAPGIKAAFFTAGATNDFFFWPPAVQATLDAIPGEKNHLFAPNANHKVPLPGGSDTQFPYFDFYLKGIGHPFPIVTTLKSDDPLTVRCKIAAPVPIKKVDVYWSGTTEGWMKRKWLAVPASKSAGEEYEAKLPAEAAAGADWFFVASDERPVTVCSDLMHLRRG